MMDFGTVDWEASARRSKERCKPPSGRAKDLLKDLNESKHFWYALRRHGDVATCTSWLEKLRTVSTFDNKNEYEQQRKEYLKLLDEIKRWDPEFRDRPRRPS